VFGRAEYAQKDELFEEGEPLAGRIFDVRKFAGGYRYDFWRREHTAAGIGALVSLTAVPSDLYGAYGDNPASYLGFGPVGLRWSDEHGGPAGARAAAAGN